MPFVYCSRNGGDRSSAALIGTVTASWQVVEWSQFLLFVESVWSVKDQKMSTTRYIVFKPFEGEMDRDDYHFMSYYWTTVGANEDEYWEGWARPNSMFGGETTEFTLKFATEYHVDEWSA